MGRLARKSQNNEKTREEEFKNKISLTFRLLFSICNLEGLNVEIAGE